MSEAEYVADLRQSALDYQTAIQDPVRSPTHRRAIERWDAHRVLLSSSTFVAMADAWLAKNAPVPTPAPKDA